jgi:solute carrier family 25 protein 14/30
MGIDNCEQNRIEKLFREWMAGGLANAFTSSLLNPLDVTKTVMQTTNLDNAPRVQVSFLQTIRNIYKCDGLIGLWGPGLQASMIREMLNSGARAGFYVSVRDFINNLLQNDAKESSSLFNRILAASSTGTLGAVLANPIDVVKIRLMANPKSYQSTYSALVTIYWEEGIAGLYKGLIPSTLRGAAIACGELATYDHSKHLLKAEFMMDDGPVTHVIASLITGFVAATVAAPFDLIKTR